MIVELLNDEDLYNITRVSHYMAAIGCPNYLRRKGLILSGSRFSLSVRAEGFKALRVWRRSPDFSAVPMLFCNFNFEDINQIALEMSWLQNFFISLPLQSSPIFRHICLNNPETKKLQHCLDLIRAVYETGCHSITVTGLTFQDARTMGRKKTERRIHLTDLQELTLEYCQLSPSQWKNFLSRLCIPSLQELTIVGETSMVAVYSFLRQHPDIRVIRLDCTAKDVPPSSCRLKLPSLRSLHGSSSRIQHLLQSLTSPPVLDKLDIESDSLDEVGCCLAMSRGSLALEIRHISKEASTAYLMRANMCAPTVKVPTLPCTVSTVYIQFEDACDESVLVSDFPATKLLNALTICLSGLL